MRNITSPGSNLKGKLLTNTVYAELQRDDSVVEKQVKEARTKCRSIASLLTDAPNPNSKGVLMFKKRRQRAKKYTLTCFGRAEGDMGPDTGGETELEDEGSSFPSGSEVDEDDAVGTFDPTWDSGYLDLLDRRSSACPSTYNSRPQTPTNQCSGLDYSAYQSQDLNVSTNQGSGINAPAYQSPGLDSIGYERNEEEQFDQPMKWANPVNFNPTSNPSPAAGLSNGGSVGVSQACVFLTPPSHTTVLNQPIPNSNPDPTPPGSIHNRTARPFTSGLSPAHRPTTPVVFRPLQPPPAVKTVSKPTAAVSMVTVSPPRPSGGPEARRAISSTSLYIPPRSAPSILSPPLVLSPSSSLASAPFSPTRSSTQTGPHPSIHTSTFSTSSGPHTHSTPHPQPTQPSSPPPGQTFPPPHGPIYQSSTVGAQPFSPVPTQQPFPPPSQPFTPSFGTPYSQTQAPPPLNFNPYTVTTTPAILTPSTAQSPVSDSLASREQRIAVPAFRTGILAEARRRGNKKPMFRPSVENKKDVSPNPALLELLQNPDTPTTIGPGPIGLSGGAGGGETGAESGPEEDWLRLGAEACNFMQTQRGPQPPPVAPKPKAPPQVPQLAGKGGQLFARRQSRMDRYVVDSAPSSPQPSLAHLRQASPTPSLPSQFKYSSSCRAPPPISYNPLLSPSCPPQAQRQRAGAAGKGGGPTGHKAASGGQKTQGTKATDFLSYQPYQLNSSLFSYGGGTPQPAPGMTGGSQGPIKMPRVYEVKRFSTPPPTGPVPTVIAPRSATTLGEPLWRSDVISPLPTATSFYPSPVAYQPPPQWAPPPPAPTTPLPQLPSLSSAHVHKPPPDASQPYTSQQGNRQFKSAPELSPLVNMPPRPASSQPSRVPRPRFSTSNLGLQASIWRPGSTMH
uniref:Synaptopodin 2-like b n=1 Tax=Esox lucius TaxID=8010 RepID=A0A3P8XBM5_ESOLU